MESFTLVSSPGHLSSSYFFTTYSQSSQSHQITMFSQMGKCNSLLTRLPASSHTLPSFHTAASVPSDCKLEYIPPLAKTVPWHPSFLHFDVHTPPQDLAPAHLSNLTSFLPPPTHPVSATSAFFPFHDCAKPLSTSGPELFLVFCLEQPFFPQLFTRWLIPFLRGQLTCQLLTRKLAYQAVKSSPFLTPDNYTSPSLPPIIFICFWACLFLPLQSSTTRIKNLPGALHQCIPKDLA